MPANEIIGLPPGEVFGHRNVAVQVTHVRALELSSRIKRFARLVLNGCLSFIDKKVGTYFVMPH